MGDSGEQAHRNPLSWLLVWPRPKDKGDRPVARPHPAAELSDAGTQPRVRKGTVVAVALPCGGVLLCEPWVVVRAGAAPTVELVVWARG